MENVFILWVYMMTSFTFSISFFITWKLVSSCRSCRDSPLYSSLDGILIAGFTFLWYAISVSFTIFNKWFLSEWRGGFEYPIICSTLHLTMKFVLTRVWVSCHALQFESVSTAVLFKIVVPIGIATAMDIMLSNVSLLHISVTLYTVVKASVVVWVFFWGVLFRLEKFRVVTFMAVAITSAGLMLAVSTHTSISVIGLVLCLGAAASGGLRWALTQQLLVSDESSRNVFIAIYRFSPASALSMAPFALGLELPVLLRSPFAQDREALLQALSMTLAGGFIAFALILVEVNLVRLSSSLTMGMLGQLKEILQIALALMIFRDELHWVNGLGIVVSLLASAFYRYVKAAEARESALSSNGYLAVNQVESELDVFDETGDSQDENLSDNNDNEASKVSKFEARQRGTFVGNTPRSIGPLMIKLSHQH